MTTALRLIDLVDAVKTSAAADATGACEVVFDPVHPDQVWRVGLINVLSTSSIKTPTALVYVGEATAPNLRSGTANGSGDTADQSWPIIVPATLSLRIHWSRGDAGSVGTAAIQYEVYQRFLIPDAQRHFP